MANRELLGELQRIPLESGGAYGSVAKIFGAPRCCVGKWEEAPRLVCRGAFLKFLQQSR